MSRYYCFFEKSVISCFWEDGDFNIIENEKKEKQEDNEDNDEEKNSEDSDSDEEKEDRTGGKKKSHLSVKKTEFSFKNSFLFFFFLRNYFEINYGRSRSYDQSPFLKVSLLFILNQQKTNHKKILFFSMRWQNLWR